MYVCILLKPSKQAHLVKLVRNVSRRREPGSISTLWPPCFSVVGGDHSGFMCSACLGAEWGHGNGPLAVCHNKLRSKSLASL